MRNLLRKLVQVVRVLIMVITRPSAGFTIPLGNISFLTKSRRTADFIRIYDLYKISVISKNICKKFRNICITIDLCAYNRGLYKHNVCMYVI